MWEFLIFTGIGFLAQMVDGALGMAYGLTSTTALLTLVPAGLLGGVLGAFLLVSVDGEAIRPYVIAYLGVMGLVVLSRVFRFPEPRPLPGRLVAPVGLTGGFVDAVGGGGWGPVVSSSLLGAGGEPRYVVGTVNLAEFFVTVAISATFILSVVLGATDEISGLAHLGSAVAGLVLGGVLAAPFAGYIVRIVPRRLLGGLVGCLIIGLAVYQGVTLYL
nr:TSUP family transporter [Roseibium aestuarii]